MTPEVRSIGSVINHAADLVEQGWCQDRARREEGEKTCYCIVGALDAASRPGQAGDYFTAVFFVAERLSVKPCGLSLSTWNDAPGRTQDEVVKLLRSVAAQGGAS